MKAGTAWLPDDRFERKDFKLFVRDAVVDAVANSLFGELVRPEDKKFKVNIKVELISVDR